MKENKLIPVEVELQNKLRKELQELMPPIMTLTTDKLDDLASELKVRHLLDTETAAHVRAWCYEQYTDNLWQMRREGTFTFGVAGNGDCHEAALLTLGHSHNPEDEIDMVLVHGEITDQRGNVCRHAWLELPDIVIDPSNFRDWPLIVSRKAYYEGNKVNPKRQLRYTIEEAKVHNEKMKTLGPWEELPIIEK